jgi:hypothetical protein
MTTERTLEQVIRERAADLPSTIREHVTVTLTGMITRHDAALEAAKTQLLAEARKLDDHIGDQLTAKVPEEAQIARLHMLLAHALPECLIAAHVTHALSIGGILGCGSKASVVALMQFAAQLSVKLEEVESSTRNHTQH